MHIANDTDRPAGAPAPRTAGSIETFIKAVAAELERLDVPGAWTAVQTDGAWDLRPASAPSADGHWLDTMDAARLHFRRQHRDAGRVTVSCGFSQIRRYEVSEAGRHDWTGRPVKLTRDEQVLTGRITSALDASPATFAKRVARLIAVYLPVVHLHVGEQRADARAAERLQVMAERIVAEHGGAIRGVDWTGATVYSNAPGVRVVQLRPDGTAAVELDGVPWERMAELMQLAGQG